jgi:hypothetical protein
MTDRPAFPSSPVGSSSVIDARQYGVGTGGALTDYATRLQNFLNALRDAGPGGRGMVPYSGQTTPFLTSAPLLLDDYVEVGGAGKGATVIKLADGTNAGAAVLKSRDFDALTGQGSTSQGQKLFGLRDMTIDGNKANNASAGHALAIYGYEYTLDNLDIRNAAGDGLWTEWGKLGSPSPNGQMEGRYSRLAIHHNNGTGWHLRGPHDSLFDLVTIQNNGGIGLWLEAPADTAVAAGSNGVNVSSFAGAGTLNVGTTVGYPSSGTLTVATGSGNRTVTYTGKTATAFTGCDAGGTAGVLATGGSVKTAAPYSGTGLLGSGLHVWGSHTVGVQCDNALLSVTNAMSEGASVGQVWLRASDCMWSGGKIFAGSAANTGAYGLKLGDAAGGYKTSNCVVDTFFGDQDFGATSAANASVDFNFTSGNRISGLISAFAGTSHITGTPAASDYVDLHAYGQAAAVNAANSLRRMNGPTRFEVGAAVSGLLVTNAGADMYNISPANNRIDHVAGVVDRWYSGAYTGTTVEVDGAKGHLNFPSTVAPAIAAVTAAIGTGGNGAAVSVTGNDRRCEVTITTASTGLGAGPLTVANLTFAQAFGSTPKIEGLVPEDGPSAGVQPYARPFSTTQCLLGFNVTPAPSTVYKFVLTFSG